MASGPDHYREAEQLLDEAIEGESDGFTRSERTAAALVHALLANAAASALPARTKGGADWLRVLR